MITSKSDGGYKLIKRKIRVIKITGGVLAFLMVVILVALHAAPPLTKETFALKASAFQTGGNVTIIANVNGPANLTECFAAGSPLLIVNRWINASGNVIAHYPLNGTKWEARVVASDKWGNTKSKFLNETITR